MEKPEGQRAKRLVFVLCPFQGHINPMLQLATIFHSRGLSITIFHPEFNSPESSNHPHFTFIPISDYLSEDRISQSSSDFLGIALALNNNCQAPFKELMERILEKEPIQCVVYDMFMHFAQTVADQLGLRGIGVRTSAAATLLAFAVFPSPHGQGYISLLDSMTQDQEAEIQFLKIKEILVSTTANSTHDLIQLRAAMTEAVRRSSAIIANSIGYLEQETLIKVREFFPAPIFPIGPFHKLAPTISTSLLKEDASCIPWLDKQAPNSVIYVSFGSLANINEKEVIEIAWGLVNSKQPFLWVARPGLVRSKNWPNLLPNDFEERIGTRGCVVRWAPQKEVLAHSAVGGFWTHCGWNSTLESLCEGVPMLCRPILGDQFVNARYVSGIWKVGFELEGELERGDIEKGIRKLMMEKEGREIRKRAMDFREKSLLSLQDNGSSYDSLNELTQKILSF